MSVSPDSSGVPVCAQCAAAANEPFHSESPTERVEAGAPAPARTGRSTSALDAIAGTPEPELGVILGTYRLISVVGRGGMGVVYKAQDTVLERDVALKLLSAATQESRERFLREARLAAGLSHPNIVTVHQVGEHKRIPFIVNELMTGGSLTTRIRAKGKLTPLEACRVGASAARALDYGHKRQIIHRDVKPPNLMVAPDGTVKLGDFGLARSLNDSQELTRSGSLMGTPQYVAPELCVGEAATASSDIYALGCTMYYLLTAEHPFKAESVYQVLYMQVHTAFPDIAAKVPGIPYALAAAINKAVAKKPADRWPTAGAMADELDLIAEEIVTGKSRRGGGGGGGRLLGWLAAAAVLAGAVYGASNYLPMLQDPPPTPADRGPTTDGRVPQPTDKDKIARTDSSPRDGATPEKDKKPAIADKDKAAATDKDKSRPPDPDKDKDNGKGRDKAKDKAPVIATEREQFDKLVARGDRELNDGRLAADPRLVEYAVKTYEDALKLLPEDAGARGKLDDARAWHVKVTAYQSLLADAEAATASRKFDAAVGHLKKAFELGVPDRDGKAKTRLAELAKRRDSAKKAGDLRELGRAALEKKEFAGAEKLFTEAVSLLPDNDPDRIAIRQDLETARASREAVDRAVEELRKLERAAVEALAARDPERLVKVLSGDEAPLAAGAGALCAFLRGYGKVEVERVGDPLRFAEPDPFGPNAPLLGAFKLVLSDDLGGGRVRRVEVSFTEPFALTGLPGRRKMTAKAWLPPPPAFAAAEQVELEKALADLASSEPERVGRRLAAAPAPALTQWLEWLETYRQAARGQGRTFEISHRLVGAAYYVGQTDPDEALATVDVGFGGVRTVRLTYRLRKDGGLWKLVEQRRSPAQ